MTPALAEQSAAPEPAASGWAEPPVAEVLSAWTAQAQPGTLQLDRYRLEYFSWGQGPLLVFIHGLGDGPRSFALTQAHLHRHFRCVSYRLPTGVGDGARLSRYRPEQLVDDLVRLVEHCGAATATLVGHSFGATVALRALCQCPERFPKGVLIGGFAHRPLPWSARALAWMARAWAGSRPLSWFHKRETLMRPAHYEPFARLPADRWEFFIAETGRAPLQAMGHWALAVHHTDLRPLLPAIAQPVLLICGDRDRLIAHDAQEQLFRGLRQAALFQIPHCGHVPTITHPRPTANAIKRFLGAPTCDMECGAGCAISGVTRPNGTAG